MLKRTMTAALMIALVITAGSATAQCTAGLYADAAGTISVTAPTEFVPFDVFLILRDEAAVDGASFKVTFPAGVIQSDVWYGPNENGFVLETPQGVIVGFGECVLGFGGTTIQVARYEAVALDNSIVNQEILLLPNLDEGLTVEYATCSDLVVPCDNTQNLLISHVIGTEAKSFGAVKSLY